MSRAAARSKVTFVCQNCGTVSNRWQGKCDGCGEWNSLVEESTFGGVAAGPAAKRLNKGRVVALTSLAGESDNAEKARQAFMTALL